MLLPLLTLISTIFALPLGNLTDSSVPAVNSTLGEVNGTNSVELPFSPEAIEAVVTLTEDVGVVYLEDAVLFVNLTLLN